MIQHILNNNPDLFDVPDAFQSGALFQLTQEQSFRMYSRIQFKYLIGANGKISSVQASPTSGVQSGPTKVTLPPTAVSAFNWITNGSGLPSLNLPAQIQIPSEPITSPAFLFDRQGGRLAGFAGGRIGKEGRYAQYALFRRDAPYIFAETIFILDADRRASQQTVRLSVDKVWSSTGTETGTRFFNEIRVFRRDYSDSSKPFVFVRKLTFAQNPGMLREFVLSLPLLTFESAEPQPTVTTTP
jgi:hypothetical protein